MSITTADFKTGMTILYNNQIFTIVDFQHVKPGKGQAFVRTKLRNLRTGTTTEYSFNAGEKLEQAMIEKKKMQYLYGGSEYCFMDMETYEQVELNKKQIENEVKYLKEGLEVIIIFFEGEMLGIELPEKISFKITKTEPGIKGNTATNATKDAIIETGMLVKVPLFIEQDEEIIVSTKDGKYVSRK